jgi:hypothetical protein
MMPISARRFSIQVFVHPIVHILANGYVQPMPSARGLGLMNGFATGAVVVGRHARLN